MSALLERADQVVSITDLSRSAKELFSKLAAGVQDKYVVMKNNAPAGVVLAVGHYEAMLEELEDLRVEAVAVRRFQSFDRSKAISHEEMKKRFAEK